MNSALGNLAVRLLPHRNRLSSIALAGWAAFVVVGQCVVNRETIWLEWLAALWLWAGILLVRPADCMPLVILTYPAFMCENHRDWAWVLPMAICVLLVRILVSRRISWRQRLRICLVGTIVLCLSWPANAGELILQLRAFPKRELLGQWLAPQAVWAIFPFRSAVDRALIAMVCAGVLIDRRYLSSQRVWQAWWLAAVLALLATFCGVLIPWQAPHHFLGTTNHAVHGARLFHGAGYNISFFSLVLILGLPSFFAALKDKLQFVRIASIGLLPPIIMIHQRAFCMAWPALLLAAPLMGAWYLAGHRTRNAFLRHLRLPARSRLRAGLCLVCGLTVTGAWFVRMGGLEPKSLLRQQLGIRTRTFFAMDDYVSTGLIRGSNSPISQPVEQYAKTIDPEGEPVSPDASPLDMPKREASASLGQRLQNRLTQLDAARGHMWSLGLRTSLEKYVWHGAGAGTWARFHRSQPRPKRIYFAHMHNTCLDLMFEYGIVPSMIVFVLCSATFVGILIGVPGVSRLWIFFLLGVAVMALGQHLLYAFTTMCLLLPVFIIVPLALLKMAKSLMGKEPTAS